MSSFTNFDDLLKAVGGGIEDSLKTDVPVIIKQKISQAARENVILETAGRAGGGIDDINAMEDSLKKTKESYSLSVKDIAEPSPSVFGQEFDDEKNAAVGGTMFANWIENGEWIDLKEMLRYRREVGWNPGFHETWASYKGTGHGDGLSKSDWNYKPRREKRPFISLVQKELNDDPTVITNAILKKIKKAK